MYGRVLDLRFHWQGRHISVAYCDILTYTRELLGKLMFRCESQFQFEFCKDTMQGLRMEK